MKTKLITKNIAEALRNNQPMPAFSNALNEQLFYENMTQFHSEIYEEDPNFLFFNKSMISEESWLSNKDYSNFFLALFSHWTKLLYDITIYFTYVEYEDDFPDSLELDMNNKTLVLFYNPSKVGEITKMDQCIYEVDGEWIKDFFDWVYFETLELDGFDNLVNKYKSLCNLFSETSEEDIETIERDGETVKQFSLSEEFYTTLEQMKESIISSFGDLKTEDSVSLPKESETPKEQALFSWNNVSMEMNFPLHIPNSIKDDANIIEFIDTDTKWLSKQDIKTKSAIVAIWSNFISYNNLSQYKKDNLSWADMDYYFKNELKITPISDPKQLPAKHLSIFKCIARTSSNLAFIEIDSLLKAMLFFYKKIAIEQNKKIIFDIDLIQNQHYFSLTSDSVSFQMWNALALDRILKTNTNTVVLEKFEQLAKKFPNFSEVIDYYSGAMHIFEKTGTPPAPVLLLGSPGLGKTHFVTELSNLLGTLSIVIPVSSLTAGWIISGASPQWKDAQIGKIVSSSFNCETMSPAIVFDEIDKKLESNYDPLGSLYPLLEEQTAKNFVDEFLQFPVNASKFFWFATANKLHSIPEPILDRFIVFEIQKLNKEQTIEVSKTIFNELTYGLDTIELSSEILNTLQDKNPREIKQTLKKGLAYAAKNRPAKIEISNRDIQNKLIIKKIGF